MTRRLDVKRLAVAAIATLLVVAGVIAAAGGRPDPAAPSASCSGGAAEDFSCHARRLVALTERSGARVALRDLAQGMKDSRYLLKLCHPLVHHIGRTAGRKAGMQAFADGDAVCASGYYHGVTEAVVTRMAPREAIEQAQEVCAGLEGRPSGTGSQNTCWHGLGHGFMNVLESDLRASLRGCDTLRPAGARRECYSGVFMENHMSAGNPERSSLRPLEPLYPCTALPRVYKPECYERQTSYALHVSNGDFATVFRLCAAAERDFRAACRRALGGDVAAETRDLAALAEQALTRRRLCGEGGRRRARTDCVEGVVDVVVRDPESEPFAEVDAFCAAWDAPVTQVEYGACLRAAETRYRGLVRRLRAERAQQPPGP